MSFTLRNYKDMMEGTKGVDESRNGDGFEDTRATMKGEHHATSVSEIDQPRRHQIQFIDKARELLHGSEYTNEEKASIMTGLMLLERAIIAKSYGENIFDITALDLKTPKSSKSARGSTYFRSLAINIGLKADNSLDEEDFKEYLLEAQDFITSHVYEEGLSRRGFKQVHPFSDIEQLNIPEYINVCNTVIAEAGFRIVDRNLNKLSEELRLQAEEVRKKELAAAEERRLQEEEARKKDGPQTTGGYSLLAFLGVGSLGSPQLAKNKEDDEQKEEESKQVNGTVPVYQ